MLGHKSEIFVPPERMNIFSYKGLKGLIEKMNGFEILEFSTPSVLDIPNVIKQCVIIPTQSRDTITSHAEAWQAVVWHMLVTDPRIMAMSNKWESLTENLQR